MKIVRVFGFLVWVGVLGVCFGEREKGPTAGELLDKFGKTQEKLRSFIAQGECTQVYMDNFSSRPQYVSHHTFEARTDGTRSHVRTRMWGDLSPTMTLTKDMPYYKSRLWDGKDSYSYDRTTLKDPVSKGSVAVVPHPGQNVSKGVNEGIITGFPLMRAMGCIPMDAGRVDSAIRNSKSLSVRSDMERVGSSDCYVIVAKTDTGNYELYVDPSHDYHIAEVRLRKATGHKLQNGYVLSEGDSCVSFVKNVRFEKIDTVWVPIEFDFGHERIMPKGSMYKQTAHFKVTEITLNPDHEPIKSFVPDDIPDGAQVRIIDDRDFMRDSFNGKAVTFTWRDGKVVDGEGKEVDIKAKVKRQK